MFNRKKNAELKQIAANLEELNRHIGQLDYCLHSFGQLRLDDSLRLEHMKQLRDRNIQRLTQLAHA